MTIHEIRESLSQMKDTLTVADRGTDLISLLAGLAQEVARISDELSAISRVVSDDGK